MLTIVGSEYNPEHNVLEVYVAGCARNCQGCHNPEAQKFGIGKRWALWLRENAYKLKQDTLIQGVWILGGDLLCHPEAEVVEFLRDLRRTLPKGKQLALWTGADTLDALSPCVAEHLDWVKLGHYMKDCPTPVSWSQPYELPNGELRHILLASENQSIVMLKEYDHDK